MLGEVKKQFSSTRAAFGKAGAQRRIGVIYGEPRRLKANAPLTNQAKTRT